MEDRRRFFRNYTIVFILWLALSQLSTHNRWTDIGWCLLVSSLSIILLVLLHGAFSYNRPQDYPKQQIVYWLQSILFGGGLGFFAVGYLLRALSFFGIVQTLHLGSTLAFVGAMMFFPSLYLIPFLIRQTAKAQSNPVFWDKGNEGGSGSENASSPSRLPPFIPVRSAQAAKSLPSQGNHS